MNDEQTEDYMQRPKIKALMDAYVECDAIVQRLARGCPEDPKVWIGTVPQRLAYIAGLITGDVDGYARWMVPEGQDAPLLGLYSVPDKMEARMALIRGLSF